MFVHGTQGNRSIVTLQDVGSGSNPNIRRRIVPYYSNFTPSIVRHQCGDFDQSRCKDWKDGPDDDELNLAQLIKHHAYQRMQLFYLTAVAYWREGCEVKQGSTRLQHGKSRCNQCSAAHSAILPSLVDDHFQRLQDSLARHGLTPENEGVLHRLGIPREKWPDRRGKRNMQRWKVALEGVERSRRKGILADGIHLHHTLNTTVELPGLANECDSVIEAGLRGPALALINRASQLGEHPNQVTRRFEKKMQDFLEKALQETGEKVASLSRVNAVVIRIESGETTPFQKEARQAIDKERAFLQRCSQYSLRRGMRNLLRFLTPRRVKFLHSTEVRRCLEVQREALTIFRLQKEGSICPPFPLMSGKMTPMGRVPLTDKELMEEKERILRPDYQLTYSKGLPLA